MKKGRHPSSLQRRWRDLNPRAGHPTYTLAGAPLRPLEYISELLTFLFDYALLKKCKSNYNKVLRGMSSIILYSQ